MDEKTKKSLNSILMSIMQNLSDEEKAALNDSKGDTVKSLDEINAEWEAKIKMHIEAEEVAKAKEAEIERLQQCNIEQEFYNARFDDYKPFNATQKAALDAVKELVGKKTGKVILLGANGLGKTFLGAIAVKMLGGKMYTMFEISCLIREAYSPLAKKTELEILEELASVPMLFIDELGRSKSSEAERNWLSYVIDKRHTKKLPLMIGGNVHLQKNCSAHGCPHCFERFFGRDVQSRFLQNTRIVEMQGEDYRKCGGER